MIFELLEYHGIAYQRFDHPPVYTCDEARQIIPELPGAELKNLFLRDSKGKRHFLLGTSPDKKVNLKELGVNLGVSGLGFASPERLRKYLNLEPGSVTLLAVINDQANNVELLIDDEVWKADAFQCHPLVNTSTLVIGKYDLERFFLLAGHPPRLVRV